MSKRLLKELSSEPWRDSPALESVTVVDDNVFHWHAVLKGPQDTPYSGGRWTVNILMSPAYPHEPPKLQFITPICHPNIHFETGEVCIDILKTQWTPAWNIASVLLAVQAMLSSPEPDSPLNVDAANLVRQGEDKGYGHLIEYYKHRYALPPSTASGE